jgi:hypothetical protein
MEKAKPDSQNSQHSAWKDIIKDHFSSFICFYFPHIASEMDFSKPPEFLGKELDRLIPQSSTRGRYADLLVKTHTRSGKPVLLFAHIEVQGRSEEDFEKRMFTCAYRIFDALGDLPVSLVVLTDCSRTFHPKAFEINSFGRCLRLEFQVAKLLYWEKKQQELEESGNIFAFVTLAQLQASRCRGRGTQQQLRDDLKKELILLLLRKGYRKPEIRSLLRFLDWLVRLPEGLEKQLSLEIEEETGGKTMGYVTSWERIAKKEGMMKGKKAGKREGIKAGKLEDKRNVLTRLLDRKFSLTAADRKRIARCADTV